MPYIALPTAFLLMLLGLLGIILPVLPGIGLIFLGMVVYGFATGFQAVSPSFLGLMLLLTIVGTVLDYVAAAYGAKRTGASKAGTIGAILGGIGGAFVFPPYGFLLGPLAGAFLGELYAGKQTDQATRASLGTLLGMLGGIILKLAIAAVMLVLFIGRVRS